MPRSLIPLVFSILAATGVRAADLPEPPDWADVSRIFAERCTMCHSEIGAARGLRLDTYEAAIAGGERGTVIVSGDSEHSLLVRRLRGQIAPRMPFLSRPLPDDQIDLIVRWIDAGLPRIQASSVIGN